MREGKDMKGRGRGGGKEDGKAMEGRVEREGGRGMEGAVEWTNMEREGERNR